MSDVSGDRLDMKSSIFSSNILVLKKLINKTQIKLGSGDFPCYPDLDYLRGPV